MAEESIIQRAGHILSAILRGTFAQRDVPGAPPATHDFDLTLSDGRVIAVEVTISTDPKVAEFWNAASNCNRPWKTSLLRHSWLLNVAPPANIKALRANVEPWLETLERARIHKFGLGSQATGPEIRFIR